MTPIGFGLRPLSYTSRSVSGGFSPTDIVKLWIDQSDATKLYIDTVGGTNVSNDGDVEGALEDKTGNGWDATQTTTSLKSLYKTGIQNSLSAGQYISDWHDFNNVATPVIPSTAGWGLYMNFRTGSNIVTSQALFTQYVSTLAAGREGRFLFRIVGGNIALFIGNQGALPSVTAFTFPVSINTNYIISLRRDGDSYIFRVNGSDEEQYDDTGTRVILQTGTLIGGRTGSNPYNNNVIDLLNAHMFEIFFQDGTPTTGNLENMDTYSNTKWSIY